MADRKRKAELDTTVDEHNVTPLSPEVIHGRGRVIPGRRTARPSPTTTHSPTSQYYYDNCLTLYEQYVESLNQAYARVLKAGGDPFWLVCEYTRLLRQLKLMYQTPYAGKVLTCGMSDMESLGYDFSSTVPKVAKKSVKDLHNICKLSCGSTFTLLVDTQGKMYAFGSQDEGGMGREGEAADGDLQVKGFIPHPKSKCPLKKEDDCIIMVQGGSAKSLALTIHNNLYTMGCFRDYDDVKFREQPIDVNEPDRHGKKFPFGIHYSPCHVYDLPPGTVKDLACGSWMAACIVNDDVVTWGVGTKGELGRPVASREEILNKSTGEYNLDLVKNSLLKPTIVPSLMGKVAISVACGQGHLMVVARERGSLASTVYGSGVNRDGQLGLGDTEPRKVLTPVEYTRTNNMMIAKVECGNFHTLALSLDAKRMYACGKNADGQTGTTEETPDRYAMVTKFEPVLFPEADLEFEQIACGEEHSMAICKPKGGTRQVYTWGSTVPLEDACVLGHGEEDKSEIVPRLLQLKKPDRKTLVTGGVWRQVSGGAQHSAFLYTPAAPKESSEATGTTPARNVRRKIG